ncbi:MAG: o-succinylbenzoate synthase [Phycisphaerales bacterium]|nr:o-succinylbenzoate synthase [Phycisphaerales bacterium]
MTVDLAYFELPFKTPYKIGVRSISMRRGVIVRQARGKKYGYGEVSPLPGLHRETLEQAVASLMDGIHNHSTPMLSSASFGLSCAIESAARNPRYGLNDAVDSRDIGVNALFSGSAREAKAAFAAGAFDGFRTIKIKIGRARSVDDLRMINTVLELAPEEVRLRLDGNQGMTLDAAERLLSRLDASRIEYVEEPLRNHEDLSELARRVNLPMAIDESLHTLEVLEHVLGAPQIEVQVVRPSLIGSLEEVESVITRGRINGMDTVLSTALESSYTIALVARLASAAGVGDRDHGLGTASLLALDLVTPTPVVGGRMAVCRTLPVPQLDFVRASEFTLPASEQP